MSIFEHRFTPPNSPFNRGGTTTPTSTAPNATTTAATNATQSQPSPQGLTTTVFEAYRQCGMRGERVHINAVLTPELASHILKHCNLDNREIRPAKVARYASEMREGRWRPTFQGIIFDSKGGLLTGQHRCQAVVSTGISIPVSVGFGDEPETRLIVDRHTPKSVGDILQESKYLMATANAFAAGIVQSRRALPPQRMEQLLELYRSELEWAVKNITAGGLNNAVARAVFARAIACLDDLKDRQARRESLRAFHQAFLGEGNPPRWSPAYALSTRLAKNEKLDRPKRYGLISSALRLHVNGERVATELRLCSTEVFKLDAWDRDYQREVSEEETMRRESIQVMKVRTAGQARQGKVLRARAKQDLDASL